MQKNKGKILARRLITAQLLIVLAASLFLTLINNIQWLWSTAVGGGLVIIGNVLVAWLTFQRSGARASRAIVNRMYLAEGLKIALLTIVMACLLYSTPLLKIGLIVGFIVAIIGQWLSPILFLKVKEN